MYSEQIAPKFKFRSKILTYKRESFIWIARRLISPGPRIWYFLELQLAFERNIFISNSYLSYFSAEKKEKEYYSLGCLLYFLKNEHLSHPKYVQQAAGDKISVVRRPDRRTLLDYLHGKETQHPKNIDKTARLEMPTHVKRTAEDKIDHIGSAAKKAKLDGKVSNCLKIGR